MALLEQTRIGFVNAALGELGETIIEDGDDLDDTQEAALTLFDTVKDKALYGYPWTWARAPRRALTMSTDLTAQGDSGYEFVWNYPAAEIGVLLAVYEDNRPEAVPRAYGWTRQGNYLLTDFQPVYTDELADVAPEAWPTLFASAMVPLLCSRLAMLVREDPQLGQHYRRIHDELMKEAIRVDAQSKPARSISRFSYLEARWGSRAGERRIRTVPGVL